MLEILTRYDQIPYLFKNMDEIDTLPTGDWHCGDKDGMNPPLSTSLDGTSLPQNKIQKRMYDGLVENLSKIGYIDLLILMGYLAEWKQLKAMGIPLNDSNTDTQVNMAFNLYKETFYEYCKPRKVLAVMGTPYHVMVGIGGNLDYQIADKISRISDVIFGYPNIQFYLGRTKMLWDIQHRISIARVNRTMPIEKTFRQYYRQVMEDGTGEVPNVIGRAHRHVLQEPMNLGKGVPRWGFVSPALKAQDVYTAQLPYPTEPTVGVMKITQKKNNLISDYYPININRRKVKVYNE